MLVGCLAPYVPALSPAEQSWSLKTTPIIKTTVLHAGTCVSYGLNSVKGGYIGDYIGEYYRGYEGGYGELGL